MGYQAVRMRVYGTLSLNQLIKLGWSQDWGCDSLGLGVFGKLGCWLIHNMSSAITTNYNQVLELALYLRQRYWSNLELLFFEKKFITLGRC